MTTAFVSKTTSRLQTLLMPNEVVQYAAWRHWLSYFKPVLVTALATVAIYFALTLRQPDQPFSYVLQGVTPLPGDEDSAVQRWMLEWLAVVLLGLGAVGFTLVGIVNRTTQMAVTNRRLILRTGLIARDIADIPLSKIDLVLLEQGVLDRLVDCGDVVVRTVGEATTRFARIGRPSDMRNAVVQAMETAAKAPAAADGKAA